MTFAEFKTLVMQHLNQNTISGAQVPSYYNLQNDYLLRICALLNAALNTIATTTRPIMASFNPNDPMEAKLTDMGHGWTKISMPKDFWKMTGQGLPRFFRNGDYERTMDYRMLTDNEIVVRSCELPSMMITYYRYPRKVQGQDQEIIDAEETVAICASYYVAAELARYDSPYLYQSLYNEYEAMLERLRKPLITENSRVEEAYFIG